MTPAVDSPLERSLPTPFLTKTYQLVEDPASDDIISWNDDGSAFVVWKPAEFARDLLPKYFKHNNFSSFVRQLNTYGFRKIVPDRWEFSNESFKKGEKQLLREIQRRKISTPATPTTPTAVAAAAAVTVAIPAANLSGSSNSGDEQVVSSNSSPPPPSGTIAAGCSSDLLEENERLRRENSRLSNELGKMKNLCSNIYSLMSKYGGESPSVGAAVELNLMPRQMSEVTQVCTKIFGVSIGSKRAREEVESDVKLEPFDSGSGSGSGSGSNLQSECIDKSPLGKKV